MANGLLSDWMSGTGVYGSPNAIDPSTGVPYADVRSAQLGALGNIGSLLIAAGQPMTGAQRAQLLGQIGPQLSGMQTDIYNPQLVQEAYASPRSLHAASDVLYATEGLDADVVRIALGLSDIHHVLHRGYYETFLELFFYHSSNRKMNWRTSYRERRKRKERLNYNQCLR